jgi:hypothetical protein
MHKKKKKKKKKKKSKQINGNVAKHGYISSVCCVRVKHNALSFFQLGVYLRHHYFVYAKHIGLANFIFKA